MSAQRIDLGPDAASVQQARSFVSSRLVEWGCEEVADTAALLTCELATNAILHAQTPYAVVLTRTLCGARVDVLDRSADLPHLTTHDLAAPTGRGLALVACLSSEWGSTPPDDLEGFTKGVRFCVG